MESQRRLNSNMSSASSRSVAIREQIEYYLSDGNLLRDAYFRNLIEADPEGWLNVDPHILRCPRIKELDVNCMDIAQALQDSNFLDVDSCKDGLVAGDHVFCRIRRKNKFEAQHSGDAEIDGMGIHRDKGKSKGKGKGNVTGKGKGKGEQQRGPIYDPSTPCGYFMAGYCRYGDDCHKQHSVPYALAIRHEWLHPGEKAARKRLQQAAENALGPDVVSSANLFPRVFSQRLDASAKGLDDDSPSSDLGFEWEETNELSSGSVPTSQAEKLRYLLVLDLEGKDEIIEFPVIVIDAKHRRELGRFQHYVRPVSLFAGCPLTASSPAIPFAEALQEFNDWLIRVVNRNLHDIGQAGSDTAFVTCGDWDCKHVHSQCALSGIPVPSGFSRWVNIKRLYSDTYGGDFRGMKSMLAKLRMLDRNGDPKFGFHHLGMHDVENIGRCLLHLLDYDVEISINGVWKR
eukprot:TRINITY_DN6316_c0_g3_i1.p1 TRINITY_DN6316_c0_g3~~TRINITY_DN6316_c0_g3_i1.p1  ORF type:complete len:469 (+),score=62.91 TRINITY_DN6316_c0_g3_i1:35-1408(+)